MELNNIFESASSMRLFNTPIMLHVYQQVYIKLAVRLLVYRNELLISPHFWNECGDKIYDPTIGITESYLPDAGS